MQTWQDWGLISLFGASSIVFVLMLFLLWMQIRRVYREPEEERTKISTTVSLIGLILAFVGLLSSNIWSYANSRETRQQNLANEERLQRQDIQTYFDKLSVLILQGGLAESREGNRVRVRADDLTAEVLNEANDPTSKGRILDYLYDQGLIFSQSRDDPSTPPDSPVVSLEGANLRGVEPTNKSLEHISLRNTDLRNADLEGTVLDGADLHGADLRRTDLRRTFLYGADLRCARLADVGLTLYLLEGTRVSPSSIDSADIVTVNMASETSPATDEEVESIVVVDHTAEMFGVCH